MKKHFYSKAVACLLRGFVALSGVALLYAAMPLEAYAADAQQQKVKVEGVVVDQNGDPMIGAMVSLKGTNTAELTDVNGAYTLSVPVGSTLEFSFLGYKTQSFQISQAQKLDVTMHEDLQKIDEVVVVGFAQQKKANLTGAVASVNVEKAFDSKPIVDVSKGLQGITPGLNISFGSGNLGNSASMNIRGTGTIVSGNQSGSPLVLVDGVPTSLDLINPDDIATISILKDAASASIYGARAAFGVILITTKSGKSSDKVKFSYSGNIGFNNPGNLVQFLDADVELPAMIAAQQRAGNANAESFGMLYKTLLPGVQKWKTNPNATTDPNNLNMVYGTDWDIIDNRAYFYRIWNPHEQMLAKNAMQTYHNLSAQGKLGEKSSFIVSLGYSDQKGPMKINQEDMQRINVNLGLSTELAKWLKADFRLMNAQQDYNYPYNYYNNGLQGGGGNGYFGYYMRWGTFFPYGTYNDTYFRHAPGYMANANMNTRKTNYNRMSVNLTAQITKEINLVAEYSLANQFQDHKLNGGSFNLWDFWSAMPYNSQTVMEAKPTLMETTTNNSVSQSKSSTMTQLFNAYLNYNKSFGEGHNFKAMAGMNTEWNSFERNYARREGLLDPKRPEFGLATGTMMTYFSSHSNLGPALSQYAIAGFFARVNYDYKGIWLAEVNARYDGSSRFPTTNQWGFFPSASVGYRFTEEEFMASSRGWLNDGKIRASYGSIGNQNIAANAFLPMMTSSSPWWIYSNNVIANSVNLPTNIDPNLTWETVNTLDIGVDLRLLDMFTVTADWYQRDTKGMLAPGKTLPATFGQSAANTNAGNLQTRGWEIMLGFNKRVAENVTIYADLTLADNITKVTKWDNVAKTLGSMYEGQTLGEIWGLTSNRLIQANDQIAANKLGVNGVDYSAIRTAGFTWGAGDVLYEDINGDGKITRGAGTVDDSGDLSIIGNSTPRYSYGIRLGATLYGFDFDMFWQGVGKRQYWAASDLILPFYNRTDAMYAQMNDYWTPDNTGAYFPNPWPNSAGNSFGSYAPGSNNFVSSTRYLLDMSYLRLKNITLGYTIPRAVTQKIKLDKVRLYVSGQNLFEFKNKNLPVDPEINETEAAWGRTFPFSRTWSFGLQLNF